MQSKAIKYPIIKNLLKFYSYETEDGQVREEMGIIMNPGTPNEELLVMGRYSYTGNDENVYTVMYTADKNGYRPRVMFKSKTMPPKKMLEKNLLISLVGGGSAKKRP